MEKAKNPILEQPRPLVTIVTADTRVSKSTSKFFSVQGHSQECEIVAFNVIGAPYPQTANSKPQDLVNSMRQTGLTEALSDWVWFLDRDCDVSMTEVHRMIQVINSESLKPSVIGGLYNSRPNSSIWQSSYNRMCNIWSLSQQIPLAGNVLVKKSKLGKDFNWGNADFGSEEFYLVRHIDALNLKIEIDPGLKVFHNNEKTFWTFLTTAIRHAKKRFHSSRRTKIDIKILNAHLKTNPLETTLTIIYFSIVRLLSPILSRKALRSSKLNLDSSSQ